MQREIVKDLVAKLTPDEAVEFIGYKETMVCSKSARGVLRVDKIMMNLDQATNWIMTIRPIAVVDLAERGME